MVEATVVACRLQKDAHAHVYKRVLIHTSSKRSSSFFFKTITQTRTHRQTHTCTPTHTHTHPRTHTHTHTHRSWEMMSTEPAKLSTASSRQRSVSRSRSLVGSSLEKQVKVAGCFSEQRCTVPPGVNVKVIPGNY